MPRTSPRRVRAVAGEGRGACRMELRLLLRNGEQLLLALVIPLGLLVLLGATSLGDRLPLGSVGAERQIDLVVPRVLALAVMSTSFTSLAIATGFERRYGVIKRLGASPLPRTGLLAGKVAAVLVVQVVQFAVLIGAGLALGWHPPGGAVRRRLVLTVAYGTAAFAALGLLMAGTLRAEATLAAANLLYLLLLAGGAVVMPVTEYGAYADVRSCCRVRRYRARCDRHHRRRSWAGVTALALWAAAWSATC